MKGVHSIVVVAALLAATPASALTPPPPLAAALLDGDGARARAIWDGSGPAVGAELDPFGGALVEARLLSLEGRTADARALYEQVAGDGDDPASPAELRAVARFELARLCRALADDACEARALDGLRALAPRHPDRDLWTLRLAELRGRAGEAAEARQLLATLESGARQRRVRRAAGAELLKLDLEPPAAYGPAARRFESLVAEDRGDEAALRAVLAMDDYETEHRLTLAASARKARGLVLYENREWGRALVHLAAATGLAGVTEGGFHPLPEPSAAVERGGRTRRKARRAPTPRAVSQAEAVYTIARIYYRMGDFTSAARVFDLVATSADASGLTRSAAFQRAVCLERGGDREGAREALELLAAGNAGPEQGRSIARRRIGLLRAAGEPAKALAVIESERATADRKLRAELLWKEASLRLPGDPAVAAELLETLAKERGDDGLRARVWLAAMHESKAEGAFAADLYRSVVAAQPRGFWGRLGLDGLCRVTPAHDPELGADIDSARAFLSSPPAGDADPVAIARERLRVLWLKAPAAFAELGVPALRQALARSARHAPAVSAATIDLSRVDGAAPLHRRLLAAGLAEEAAFVLLASDGAGADAIERAIVYATAGEADRALTLAEVWVGRIPAEIPFEAFDEGLKRLLYPLPGFVVGNCGAVDARLVAAIAREESRFKAQARSNAGARGVMQVVIDTAKSLADVTRDELYDPARSVELGALYLARLGQQFPGSVPAVIAAYNAGPDAAREWVGRAGAELLPLEEEIEYSQTQQYLAKVYLSYRRYGDVYPEGRDVAGWRAWLQLGAGSGGAVAP